jgi:hypothetical protein
MRLITSLSYFVLRTLTTMVVQSNHFLFRSSPHVVLDLVVGSDKVFQLDMCVSAFGY